MSRFIANEPGFLSLVSPGGIVDRGVAKASGRTRDRAKRLAPVDTGALRQDLRSERLSQTTNSVTYRVGTTIEHGLYQNEGTGIYGPKHRPIVPRRAKFLRFQPKGSSAYVFTKSVKGVKPKKFLQKALAMLTSNDFT